MLEIIDVDCMKRIIVISSQKGGGTTRTCQIELIENAVILEHLAQF